ncbi:hypothetical protein HAX54_013510, partial [Datura stramonium]|nr:hypothetical protein [Datura stramonium]
MPKAVFPRAKYRLRRMSLFKDLAISQYQHFTGRIAVEARQNLWCNTMRAMLRDCMHWPEQLGCDRGSLHAFAVIAAGQRSSHHRIKSTLFIERPSLQSTLTKGAQTKDDRFE